MALCGSSQGTTPRGFADHDWKTLAQHGEVAAIYMGKKSARFIQGRLLMHGASAATPVTIIENVSRADQRIIATNLGDLEPTMSNAALTGPALTFLGLAPREAARPAKHKHSSILQQIGGALIMARPFLQSYHRQRPA